MQDRMMEDVQALHEAIETERAERKERAKRKLPPHDLAMPLRQLTPHVRKKKRR